MSRNNATLNRWLIMAICCLLLKSLAAYSQEPPGFGRRTDYTVGSWPTQVCSADFNGDSWPDLAVSNHSSSTISILTNNGDGTFQTSATYNVGSYPHGISTADLDGDGDYDLVFVNTWSNNYISVMLNTGAGSFAPPAAYTVGSFPLNLYIADLDGDNDLDIAVSCYNAAGRVYILLNNGNGTFSAGGDYANGSFPTSVYAADFDGDSDNDLAVTNSGSNTVSILLNNGNGTYQPAVDYATGSEPLHVYGADFDGDTYIDLAVANQGTSTVSIFRNNGNAIFSLMANYPVGSAPRGVACADLDGDQDCDLVVAASSGNNATILINDGTGTFQSGGVYALGSQPRTVCVADLDKDGHKDLVFGYTSGDFITVLYSNNFCDDFENYSCSSFPSSGGWSIITSGHGTSEQYIDCSVAYSGTKSFHLSGATNWSAIVHNDLPTAAPVIRMTATMRLAQVDCTPYCIPGYGIGGFGFRNGTDPWGYPEFAVGFGVLENGALAVWDGLTPIELNYNQWYTLAVEVNTITKTYSRWLGEQELGSPISYAGSPDPIGIALVSGNMGHTTTWFDDVCVDTTSTPSTTIWIDSATVNGGYSQVMMRNTMDVSAFTIPLIHDSHWDIDSVSRIGCRTENWESFNKTINNAAKTVLFGGMANFGGGTPCMPPGEGCVAKIYWHKNCDIYATVCFDTTFISSASQLLVVDCEIPSHELPVAFVKGCSKYQTYLFGDVNGDNQVDLSDVVCLVHHVFLNECVPVPSPCAGDVNGDCKTNLTDAVSLVNYIFTGAPAPVAYCSHNGEFSKRAAGEVEIGSTNKLSDQFSIMTVSATAGQQIKGAQLEFTTSGNIEIVEVTNNVAGMQEFHGSVDGKFKVGLLDLRGEATIPAGTNDVVTIKYKGTGEIELVNAIMVGTDAAEMNVTLSSDKTGLPLPTAFSLAQNSPNPFNPTTEIAFAVPRACPVRLEILNVLGQSVRTLVDEFKAAGNYQVTWDSRDNNSESVSSGVYFYRLSAGEFADTKKMMLMK